MTMHKTPYSHVLQKTGILKNFTVAKVVRKKEIEDLKKLIKKISSSEEEYKRILDEEMLKMSNMHDKNNPIPGIIYKEANDDAQKFMYNVTKKFCQGLKKHNLSKHDLAFLITAIINELGLTQEDFKSLRDELSNQSGEEDDEVEEGEDESPDDYPPKF